MELTAATRMLTLRLVETKDKEDEHTQITVIQKGEQNSVFSALSTLERSQLRKTVLATEAVCTGPISRR